MFDFTWIIAVISIVGSFLNIKKNPVCFYLWVVCEVMYWMIDTKNQQYGRAFLDFFYVIVNIYGICSWSKKKKES